MTEQEWFDCTDPTPMLEFLRSKESTRKWRLFVCACVRAEWELLSDPRSRNAVIIAERFIEGMATLQELDQAGAAAVNVLDNTGSAPARSSSDPADFRARFDLLTFRGGPPG